jgi:uncharacterized protein YndB with AHSA1/START domain
MPESTGGRPRLRIERLLPAPVERAYNAWVDPEAMSAWFSPTGSAEIRADVRVGGRLQVVMVGAGRRIEHTGEYVAVDPPKKLSFTWRSPYTGDRPSIVSVLFDSVGDATRIVLTHEDLPDDAIASHEGGWGSILDRLAATLRSKELA